MATSGGFAWDESYTAASDLSSSQYYIVKTTASASRVVSIATGSTHGATARVLGVLQNDPSSGEAATVPQGGRTKVVAGEAITAGTPITSSTGGLAVTAASTGLFAFGRAVTASTASGQVIEADVWFGALVMYSAGGSA